MQDVLVFSAFGRGHRWAAVARRAGLKVGLVDVSRFLGAGWWAEDLEGPFGWSADNPTRLENDYIDKATDGLCLWPPQGPILFEQSESLYKLKQWGCSQECIEYLQLSTNQLDATPLVATPLVATPLVATPLVANRLGASQLAASSIAGATPLVANQLGTTPLVADAARRSELQNILRQQKFEQVWWAHLSHHLVSSVYRPSVECLVGASNLAFFKPFYVRRSTHRGRQKNLENLEGVQVFQTHKPKQLHLTKALVRGVECEGGLLGARQYVWWLTSEETRFLSPYLGRQLFIKPVLPQWQWMRYRVHLSGACVSQLPLSTVMVDNVYLSWTHANLCWLQRVQQAGSLATFDAWLLLPYHARFDKKYLKSMFKKMKTFIQGRVPGVQVKLHLGPVQLRYDEPQLGPSPWPVWAPHQQATLKAKNLYVGAAGDGGLKLPRLEARPSL